MVFDNALEKLFQINRLLAGTACQEHGFVTGTLGLAFYYFHAGRALGDEELGARGESLLSEVFEVANGEGIGLNGAWLSSGAAGLAYVVNHLQAHGFIDFDVDAELGDLDQFLFESAQTQLEHDNIDFLHGAMGIIHYFASREQTASINSWLSKLVLQALEKPIQTPHGIWVRNHGLQPHRRQEVNFSLSHGLCGYLLTLIEAWPYVNYKKRSANIIRQGIQFILKHQFPVDYNEKEYSYFPFRFEEQDTVLDRVNRLAWCYGDLNVLLLLYRAGRILGDDRYIRLADAMGSRVITRRSHEATLSEDSHFCHGSSGLAQYYKCLFRETRQRMYKEAYHYWMEHTLSLIDGEMERDIYAANRPGLLEGWTGVGLVIADHIAGEGPNWGGALLL